MLLIEILVALSLAAAGCPKGSGLSRAIKTVGKQKKLAERGSRDDPEKKLPRI